MGLGTRSPPVESARETKYPQFHRTSTGTIMLLKFFSQYVKICKFRFPEKLEGTRQGSSEAIRVDGNAGIFIPCIICPQEPDRALALERIVPYTTTIP